MHPLKEYLKAVDEPVREFAARVGASRQTLYRIIAGVQAPKPMLARRIVEATGGAVSMETLYNGGRAGAAIIVNLDRRGDAPMLDCERVKNAVAAVVHHLSPPDAPPAPDATVEIGAEAVVNTYAALSRFTTRQGPDRLAQALRPVLGEILQECGRPAPSSALDRGADLGAQLYYQTVGPARAR